MVRRNNIDVIVVNAFLDEKTENYTTKHALENRV